MLRVCIFYDIKNSSSVKISTLSCFAFSSFEPAPGPATKKLVFLLTLELTFPPNDSISSRIVPGKVDKTTSKDKDFQSRKLFLI